MFEKLSGRISIKEEPTPFIICFLARKLEYTPQMLAKLFDDPIRELFEGNASEMHDSVLYWNATVSERKKLEEDKDKKK